jgi:FtsH-binding integral membrane protein
MTAELITTPKTIQIQILELDSSEYSSIITACLQDGWSIQNDQSMEKKVANLFPAQILFALTLFINIILFSTPTGTIIGFLCIPLTVIIMLVVLVMCLVIKTTENEGKRQIVLIKK